MMFNNETEDRYDSGQMATVLYQVLSYHGIGMVTNSVRTPVDLPITKDDDKYKPLTTLFSFVPILNNTIGKRKIYAMFDQVYSISLVMPMEDYNVRILDTIMENTSISNCYNVLKILQDQNNLIHLSIADPYQLMVMDFLENSELYYAKNLVKQYILGDDVVKNLGFEVNGKYAPFQMIQATEPDRYLSIQNDALTNDRDCRNFINGLKMIHIL